MKKFFALIMVLVLSMSVLAGCGKKVKLTILDTAYTTEDYAIAIGKENTDLYDKVNGALQELINESDNKEYIVRIAKERLGLYFPDEEIIYNDGNG